MAQKKGLMEVYNEYYRHWKAKPKAGTWIGLSLFVSLVITGAMFGFLYFGIGFFFPGFEFESIFTVYIFTGLTLIISADLLIGLPYTSGAAKVDSMEAMLPDALKQMSDILKTGGTYEAALREIAKSEYGPLTDETNNILRRIEEGQNFESALQGFADNVPSRLIKRIIGILIDSVRSGAGMADILDQVAEDMREAYHLGRERKSASLMNVLFMVAAGAIVSPAIFGMVASIISFLIISVEDVGVASAADIAKAIEAKNLIILLMQLYIVIELFATSAMMSITREGKMNKTIIYAPYLLFVAFLLFYGAKIGVNYIVG